MPVEATCNDCGASFRVKDELVGRRVKCPGCGGPVPVKGPAPAGNAYDVEDYEDYEDSSATPRMKPCPYCAEMIKPSARTCPHCDSDLTEVPARSKKGRGGSRADREKKESRDKSDAIAIFVTGLIGCFAPIVAIFGVVFLVKRPYSFPCKGLAIAGTILHWIWTILLVLRFTVLRNI